LDIPESTPCSPVPGGSRVTITKTMKYDFDSIIDRRNTNSVKWDYMDRFFSVKGLLPMWVADMDFMSPPPVIEAVKKVAERGIFGYSGIPQSYCEAVTEWMQKRHSWSIKAEWIVFSPGVVPALNMLVRTFSQPGDQVIIQTPVYYPFFNVIKNNGREILDNPLHLEKEHYFMDLDDLEAKISPRTRMLILCSPHNPISRVWKEEELKQLGNLCAKRGILVVSDEIHGDIIYSGFKHKPFASISPEFADNSITCSGASKTCNLPGLHTSNIIISNPLLRKQFADTVHNCGFHSPNIFGTAATEAAYRYGEPWLTQLIEYLEGNIKFANKYISQMIPGLKIIQPQGTYLLWLDCRDCGISQEKLGSFIREEAKVGLEPGTIFGCKEDGFERMNIACPRSTLEKALDRIAAAVKSLTGR
jgi:cystathionine beta-lyase